MLGFFFLPVRRFSVSDDADEEESDAASSFIFFDGRDGEFVTDEFLPPRPGFRPRFRDVAFASR